MLITGTHCIFSIIVLFSRDFQWKTLKPPPPNPPLNMQIFYPDYKSALIIVVMTFCFLLFNWAGQLSIVDFSVVTLYISICLFIYNYTGQPVNR